MRDRKQPIINVFEATHSSSHVSHTHEVHEHRAPTDASVELLKEMEEAARAKIVESIRLDGNGFECVVQRYRDFEQLSDTVLAIFKLNEKRMTAKIYVSEFEPDWIARVRDECAKVIACEGLSEAFSALSRSALPGKAYR